MTNGHYDFQISFDWYICLHFILKLKFYCFYQMIILYFYICLLNICRVFNSCDIITNSWMCIHIKKCLNNNLVQNRHIYLNWKWSNGLWFNINVCKFVNLLICGGSVCNSLLLKSNDNKSVRWTNSWLGIELILHKYK